ncbi:hypothetical protein MCAG_02776 [Micromonospora sp. ATCC 39149]|nr:hypothetical protein MCAG_02776 [Micromonospora sp. ATCC 39149]
MPVQGDEFVDRDTVVGGKRHLVPSCSKRLVIGRWWLAFGLVSGTRSAGQRPALGLVSGPRSAQRA